jgi:hypothetical protein
MDKRTEVSNIGTRLHEDINLIYDLDEQIIQLNERMKEEQRHDVTDLKRQLNEQRRRLAHAEARVAADKALLASLSVNTEFETMLANNIRFLFPCTVNPLTCTLPDRTVYITRIGDILNLSGDEVKTCLKQHGQSDWWQRY